MTEGIATVNGARLAYEISGEGPPVVLIHGFSLDRDSWDFQVEAFETAHKVIRYDLRGFGASSMPDGAYSHVEDLAALLQFLAEAPAHLVGLSLGANVALSCALDHPHLVRSLVLASSGLPGHPWREERPPEAAMAQARAHGVTSAKVFWAAHPLFASTLSNPAARPALLRMLARYSGWHWQHTNPMIPFTADAGQLGRIKAPTLVVSGGQDVEGYREIADVLATGIPGAGKLDLPEAGHMLTLEVPDRFNAAVRAFWADVEGRSMPSAAVPSTTKQERGGPVGHR